MSVKFAIIGNGVRAKNLYIPLLNLLPNVELVGICGRDFQKTSETAKRFSIKAYKDSAEVFRENSIDAIIICVDWQSNNSLYMQLKENKKPVLIETPLGKNREEIENTYNILKNCNNHIVIAEQYHLRPIEILKRQLINKGFFGDISFAFSDYEGHEYHGISLIRSYFNFNCVVKNVYAIQNEVPFYKHKDHSNVFFNGERSTHALIEFEDNKQAIYNWSWLAYESPIRLKRMSGFHGVKGGCWGSEAVIFMDKINSASQVYFNKKTRVSKGLETLYEIIASIDNQVIDSWQNPFYNTPLSEEFIASALLIQNIIDSLSRKTESIYSVHQAYLDHQIVNMINEKV